VAQNKKSTKYFDSFNYFLVSDVGTVGLPILEAKWVGVNVPGMPLQPSLMFKYSLV
jgi:hypothetical protein